MMNVSAGNTTRGATVITATGTHELRVYQIEDGTWVWACSCGAWNGGFRRENLAWNDAARNVHR